ncbi:hypothetical protein K493DRAFT_339496 [Basidiobolus meristosporus CBS 931.73]|uniref:Uncharacterized protein n=1 Tax=Basidiobolus meristosporus CBS 931.73 TaxID=1314790 RepID=A0A1Y1XZP1_9FUNG|nr:hypothetical protein K493DRAFT_339496 [Basidiobolus meristosporus CBS 931.73]|eukprot:ORX91230.1 hypothetical protein K493DRAFT_339496 [Basidiobolus meristosporus CBS 931.73]
MNSSQDLTINTIEGTGQGTAKKRVSAFTARLRKHTSKPENTVKDSKFETSEGQGSQNSSVLLLTPSQSLPPEIFKFKGVEIGAPLNQLQSSMSLTPICVYGIPRNRKVSVETMNERMRGRQMIKLSSIQKSLVRDDIPGNWVTIGVIGEKRPVKTTKKGDPYYVVKISDLKTTISLIMFGKQYEKLWAEPLGSMIAILNPKILKPTDRNASVAIQVDHPNKFMNIGECIDFGLCVAVKKDGLNCNAIIDSRLGEYCESHLLMSYRKQRMSRMEFATGISIFEVPKPSQKRKRPDAAFTGARDESYILDNGNMLVLGDSRQKPEDESKSAKKQKTTQALIDKLRDENSIGASYIRKIQGIDMVDSTNQTKSNEPSMDSEKSPGKIQNAELFCVIRGPSAFSQSDPKLPTYMLPAQSPPPLHPSL